MLESGVGTSCQGVQRRWGRLPSHGEPRMAPALSAHLPCCQSPVQVAPEETFLDKSAAAEAADVFCHGFCALTLRPNLPEPRVFWFLALSTFYVRAKW